MTGRPGAMVTTRKCAWQRLTQVGHRADRTQAALAPKSARCQRLLAADHQVFARMAGMEEQLTTTDYYLKDFLPPEAEAIQ